MATATQVTESQVYVEGIGYLPGKLEAEFDGANFSVAPDGNHSAANCHDESGAIVTCDHRDWFVDDKFIINGHSSEGGYNLEVRVKSEMCVPFYNGRGYLLFSYNGKQKQWDMKGYRIGSMNEGIKEGPIDWVFCNAQSVVDNIAAALNCFTKKGLEAVDVLADSIKSQREGIAQRASQGYDAADCKGYESLYSTSVPIDLGW